MPYATIEFVEPPSRENPLPDLRLTLDNRHGTNATLIPELEGEIWARVDLKYHDESIRLDRTNHLRFAAAIIVPDHRRLDAGDSISIRLPLKAAYRDWESWVRAERAGVGGSLPFTIGDTLLEWRRYEVRCILGQTSLKSNSIKVDLRQ